MRIIDGIPVFGTVVDDGEQAFILFLVLDYLVLGIYIGATHAR